MLYSDVDVALYTLCCRLLQWVIGQVAPPIDHLRNRARPRTSHWPLYPLYQLLEQPLQPLVLVETSHAKVTQGTIAFFSYIWFKYDILSLHCCKLCSVVVIVLAFQPSHPGSIRVWVTYAWNGCIRSIDAVRRNRKGNAWSNLFFFKTLHYR